MHCPSAPRWRTSAATPGADRSTHAVSLSRRPSRSPPQRDRRAGPESLPPREELIELREREAVQYPVGRHPSLSRHQDTPTREIELLHRVRVGIDAHHAPELERPAVPAPVDVEPVRIGIDLDGDAMLGTGPENALDVNIVTRPTHEHAAGHVPKDGGVRLPNGAQDALGLCLLVETKAAVNARDDEVEAVQNLVRIVERAILQDVGLNALEDPKAAAIAGVQGVRFGVLSLQVLELQPSGVAGAL